jgi:hypothetical protein
MTRQKKKSVSINIRISQEIYEVVKKESENRGISQNELIKMVLYRTSDILNLLYPLVTIETIKEHLLKEQEEEYNALERRKNGERRKKNIKVAVDRRVGHRRRSDILKFMGKVPNIGFSKMPH